MIKKLAYTGMINPKLSSVPAKKTSLVLDLIKLQIVKKVNLLKILKHKDGGVPLNVLPKDTTSKLAGLFSTLSLFYAERQAGKP